MNGKKVMILQDSEESCDDIEEHIRKGGYEITGKFTDGITAISAAVDRKPDVLITGLVLPGRDYRKSGESGRGLFYGKAV